MLPADARRFDIVTIDVSFISLRQILPVVPPLVAPGGDIVALVKPQFEAGRGEVGKGGIVRDDGVRARVVEEIVQHALALGLTRRAVRVTYHRHGRKSRIPAAPDKAGRMNSPIRRVGLVAKHNLDAAAGVRPSWRAGSKHDLSNPSSRRTPRHSSVCRRGGRRARPTTCRRPATSSSFSAATGRSSGWPVALLRPARTCRFSA